MRCNQCGFDNPEIYNFCGICGQRLIWSAPASPPPSRRIQETTREEAPRVEIPSEPSRESETTLGGPSFLGLDSAKDGGYEYLLDDDAPSYRGVWVTLIVLAVFAVVVVAYWQPIRNFVIATAGKYAQSPAPPAAQTTPPPPATSENQAASPPPSMEDKAAPHSPEASTSARGEQDASRSQPSDAAKPKAESGNPAREPAVESKAKKAAESSEEEEEGVEPEKTPAKPPARGYAAAPAPRDTDQLVASGERYLYGRGVPRNCNQAIGYFRAAAEQSNPRALSRLGALYSVGECVPQDRVMAYVWFARAREADPGNSSLERNLNILWRDMTADERRRVMGANP